MLERAREFEEREFFPGMVLEAVLEEVEDFLDYEHNHGLVCDPHKMPIERNLLNESRNTTSLQARLVKRSGVTPMSSQFVRTYTPRTITLKRLCTRFVGANNVYTRNGDQ